MSFKETLASAAVTAAAMAGAVLVFASCVTIFVPIGAYWWCDGFQSWIAWAAVFRANNTGWWDFGICSWIAILELSAVTWLIAFVGTMLFPQANPSILNSGDESAIRWRLPISKVLWGVFPFAGGLLLGCVIGGWFACFVLKAFVIAIADRPSQPFDAFMVWILFGVPYLIAIAAVWQTASLILFWAVYSRPLSARSGGLVMLLGVLVSLCIVGVSGLHRSGGVAVLCPLVRIVPLAISPFLIVRVQQLSYAGIEGRKI